MALTRFLCRLRRALGRLFAPGPCEICGQHGHDYRHHYPLF